MASLAARWDVHTNAAGRRQRRRRRRRRRPGRLLTYSTVDPPAASINEIFTGERASS